MQPFVLLAFLAVGVASTAISAPVNSRDIASCEVGVAAQQVACIDGCAKDASCITAW
ncbi:hypothetical protein GQ53DRAFT_741270 [Thozetella sp. PMI_491]|nr:hypothetical protein GQ53DRAFT_741270 [Thozetella sp. PMI_491]